MRNEKTFPVILTLAALAACNGQSDTAPQPEPVKATLNPDEPVSILRPDVEQPEAEEPVALPRSPLNATIGFPGGGSQLDDQALAALKQLLETELFATGAPITLRGHSDAGGDGTINERVSRQRAEAVRDWLVENGVDKGRIRVIAFGEQNPVAPNAMPDGSPNEAGRTANRRVELQLNAPTDDTQPATPSPTTAD
jgi:OOP family OmpA-OmpF porin